MTGAGHFRAQARARGGTKIQADQYSSQNESGTRSGAGHSARLPLPPRARAYEGDVFEQLVLPLDSAEAEFRGWLESQPVPAWSSLADVPLGRRAKIARRLARQTDDVDERAELLAAACWPTGGAS